MRLKILTLISLTFLFMGCTNNQTSPADSQDSTQNINNEETPAQDQNSTQNISNNMNSDQIDISQPVDANLNQEFTLKIGQTAHIKDAKFSMTPKKVLKDTRCPVNVNCVWSGEIEVETEIQTDNGEKSKITIVNLPIKKAYFGNYLITIEKVIPGRLETSAGTPPEGMYKDAKANILPEDYIFTFKITELIVIENGNYRGVIFPENFPLYRSQDENFTRFTPDQNEEIPAAEKILKECLEKEEKAKSKIFPELSKYIRQYYGIMFGESEKVIYIEAFHQDLLKKTNFDWQKARPPILGGGIERFSIEVNIEQGTCSNFVTMQR